METFEYTILEHLLGYFINGEVEGYTEEELNTLISFEEELLSEDTFMTVAEIKGTENFGRCDILKVGGNVIDVNFNIHTQKTV